jgi:hypothetical protein
MRAGIVGKGLYFMYSSVDKNSHVGGPSKFVRRELERFDPMEMMKKGSPISDKTMPFLCCAATT